MIVILPLIFLPGQKTFAQNIGNWTFNNVLSGTPGLFNTVSSADFSASVPTRSFNGGTEYYGENGWPTGPINTSMYMQFSLTPLAGYQLDISSLILRIRRSNTGSPAGSGPTGWSLRSSLDGFAANIATGSMTLTYANYTVTPGAGFTNIYTAVTFRLYGYNASSGSGGSSRFVADNISATGIGYLLPVRLGLITASAAAKKINLSYTVYNTEQGNRYIIERSTDGTSFTALLTTEENDDAAEKKYTYADDISLLNVAEQVFYRIRLRNNMGTDTYSGIITERIKSTPAPVKIFLSNNRLYVNGRFSAEGLYQADVYSISGQALTRISFTAANGYNNFILDLNKQLPAGCIIRVCNNKGYSQTLFSVTR
ncbi:MAG: hypothetical protein ABIR15_16850 [Chitinophagaceae bacterium]